MITGTWVQMPGVLVTAVVDETDKPTTDSPGRIDSVTIQIDAGRTVEFVFTIPSGNQKVISITGPYTETYIVPGPANRRRDGWTWSVRSAG